MKIYMSRIFFICLLTGFGWISNANAAIITASSCSFPDVESAVKSASDGDTVLVPAGESVWTDSIVIDKDISLIGAGIGKTILKTNSNWEMIFMKSGASRISGITFDYSNPGYPILIAPGGDNWRIDHCQFTTTGGKKLVILVRGTQDDHPYGLIDNCLFYNGRIDIWGDAGADAYVQWTDARNFGSSEFIYIENCTFELGNGVSGNVIDGNCGNKTVIRFCTFKNTRIEQHSVQGDHRGTKAFEFYNNTFIGGPDNAFWTIWPRGGTGYIFKNQFSSISQPIYLDNVRSSASKGDYFLACDGSSVVDGNEDASGWPCRDQIGRGRDLSSWPGGPHPQAAYPDQESQPLYLWGNGFPVTVSGEGGNSDHIQGDRDYYTEKSGFDGRAGVGSGLFANRPSTCTAGVAYWATDRGSWNRSGTGGQGVLYKCVSQNQWELNYTPLTYPHPLNVVSTVKPEPPTELTPGE